MERCESDSKRATPRASARSAAARGPAVTKGIESRQPEAVLGEQLSSDSEVVAFATADRSFTAGLRRGGSPFIFQSRHDELICILDGQFTISTEASVIDAGPGDVVISSRGGSGHCRSEADGRVFWAVYV
jgi:hypothetical protein